MESINPVIPKSYASSIVARPIGRSLPLTALLVAALASAGCISSGAFYASNLTNVELGEDNYKLVATNVHGQSAAGYLLGISGSQGGYATTFALLRVEGDGLLYKVAVENLWAQFKENYGPIEGRQLALVNVQFDADASNFLGLYTKSVVSVRADVVEFGD